MDRASGPHSLHVPRGVPNDLACQCSKCKGLLACAGHMAWPASHQSLEIQPCKLVMATPDDLPWRRKEPRLWMDDGARRAVDPDKHISPPVNRATACANLPNWVRSRHVKLPPFSASLENCFSLNMRLREREGETWRRSGRLHGNGGVKIRGTMGRQDLAEAVSRGWLPPGRTGPLPSWLDFSLAHWRDGLSK